MRFNSFIASELKFKINLIFFNGEQAYVRFVLRGKVADSIKKVLDWFFHKIFKIPSICILIFKSKCSAPKFHLP